MTDDITKLRMELIKELGVMAYKSMITLSAGAFIVLLTFIGNISDSPRFVIDLANMKCALFSFLAAISFTVISMTIAYFSAQLSLIKKNLPFAGGTTGHILWLVVPLLISFATFCVGAVTAIRGISLP